MDESHWSGLLRPLFAGRRVIIKHEIVAGSVALVRAARSLGATDVFVLATNGPGTGPLPEPDEARWCSLGVSAAGGMLEGIRAGNAAIASLPEWAVEELNRFDPDHSAVVVADFLNESPDLDGRPFLAYRRPEWLALDDKIVVDELWDRCGVARSRAPSSRPRSQQWAMCGITSMAATASCSRSTPRRAGPAVVTACGESGAPATSARR